MTDPLELVALLGADPEPSPRGEDIAHGRLLDHIHGVQDLAPRSGFDPIRRPAANIHHRVLAGVASVAAVLLLALIPLRWSGTSSAPAEASALAAAQRVVSELPYPPGQADDVQVVLRTAGSSHAPADARTVEGQAQYRAWCKWLSYWLASQSAGDVAGVRTATDVLAAATQWPKLRDTGQPAVRTATAVESGDREQVRLTALARCPDFV